MEKSLNCIFSITIEVMWTMFDSYDYFMTVNPVWLPRQPLILKQVILNDSSCKTTDSA